MGSSYLKSFRLLVRKGKGGGRGRGERERKRVHHNNFFFSIVHGEIPGIVEAVQSEEDRVSHTHSHTHTICWKYTRYISLCSMYTSTSTGVVLLTHSLSQ